MLRPSEWRVKATDYAIKAHKIGDTDLRRQYAELAARFLGIADELEDVEIPTAAQADARTRRAKIRSE